MHDTPFGKPGVREITKNGETEYEVYVQTVQFSFVPGTADPIEVPSDTRITFCVTSPDVLHGFDVAGTNLNTMSIPGQVAKFTTIFPEVREYGIVCNEYCGPAHHVMEGKIKVVPKSEFDKSKLVE